jgi:hypothetical protein
MADRETVSGAFVVEGLKDTLKAFKTLDREASKEAREQAKSIADRLAAYIRRAAPPDVRNQNLAQSVKSGRDRVPVIRVGGRQTPRVSGGGGPAQLVIGMEFGASESGPNAWRFPPRTPRLGRGNQGYWIYPTVKSRQREITSMWFDAMDKIINRWRE